MANIIKAKKSSTLNAIPVSLEEGELAVCTNTASPRFFFGLSDNSVTEVTGYAHIGASPPSSPRDGGLWWNSDTGRLCIYYTDADSGQWVELIAGSSASAVAESAAVAVALSYIFG